MMLEYIGMDIKRILSLRSVVASNFTRLSFPFKLGYTVTYRCNMKCAMCNIWKKLPDTNELTLKEVESFFKAANGFSWIGISGGEPFLRDDLAQLVDIALFYCKDLNALHVATNGQLMDRILDIRKNISKRHKGLRLAYTVSIDGPESLHDRIRGVGGAWKRAVDTFRLLNNMNASKAYVGFTLSMHNIGRFEDFFMSVKDAYPRFRFNDITVNIFQKSSYYYDNEGMPDIADDILVREINKILDMDRDGLGLNNLLRRTYLKLYLQYIKTKKCPLRCTALSSSCVLDPSGNIFPCSVYNKKLMNVRELKGKFSDIWNSDYARRLSRECSNHICPSCWTPCDAYSAIIGSLAQACVLTH